LGAYYSELPVRIDIAGTIDSIAKINADTLMKCYNTFYHPSNMIILVVGEVEPSSVFHMVESMIEKKEARAEIRRIYPKEPDRLNKSYVEQYLAVSSPIFQMGYRDNKVDSDGVERLMHETAVKVLLEMLAGRSSPF
jgi:predicted Zn-dependent peptidase